MEIFIGIRGNTRQLGFDIDMSEDELMAKVNEALASAHGVLDLTDTKGQRTLVPAHALAVRADRRQDRAPRRLRDPLSRAQTNEAGEPERSRYRPRNPGLVYACGLRPSGECLSCAPRGA